MSRDGNGRLLGWLKRALRQMAATVWYRSGAYAAWTAWRRHHGPPALLIPMYHRVRHLARSRRLALEIERGVGWHRFMHHVGVMARYGKFATVSSGIRWLASSGARGVRVAVTFDDAYHDILPAVDYLIRSGGTCTVYPVVQASRAGQALWWDRLALAARRQPPDNGLRKQFPEIVKRLVHMAAGDRNQAIKTLLGSSPPQTAAQLYLTEAELGQLARRGVELGGHTVTHPTLPYETERRVRTELEGCFEFVQQLQPGATPSFAYPSGVHVSSTRSCVQVVGFSAAVTTEPGANDPTSDPYRLRRVPIGDEPPEVVALQLTWYDVRDVLVPHILRKLRQLLPRFVPAKEPFPRAAVVQRSQPCRLRSSSTTHVCVH